MLLTEILDHDLHRSRGGAVSAYAIHVPVPPDCFPAIVSNTRGDFVVSPGLNTETRLAAVGVFECNSDKLDSYVGPMLSAAFTLSSGGSYFIVKKKQKRKYKGRYKNSFSGPGAAQAALSHIRKNSGLKAQPHTCLVPSSWDAARASAFFGEEFDPAKRRFSGCCRVVFHDVPMPTFFSRPDMVGMYTQFLGGGAAVILHNVELGLAFCPQD